MPFRLLILCLLLVLVVAPVSAEVDSITTFYLVRHAKKETGSQDPNLTNDGHLRAHGWIEYFRKTPLDAVYSTETRRTRQTARPLAETNHLPIRPYAFDDSDPSGWAEELLSQHRGQTVFIVGHSNTVPEMASALSGESTRPLSHDDYDDLFVVTVYHQGADAKRILTRHFNEKLKPLRYPKLLSRKFELKEKEDLSAIAEAGDYLVVGADEGDKVQALRWLESGDLEVGPAYSLDAGGELDLEGLARSGNTFYALGSHSRGRKNVSPSGRSSHNRLLKKNRKRLLAESVQSELSRRQIVRFTFDLESHSAPIVTGRFDLQPLLEEDPFLAPFSQMASKENGVDLEGVAVAPDGALLVGCRGPVLRSGYVAVLHLPAETSNNYDLKFVNLQGRGVRDLLAVEDGFLILAGPLGDSDLSYQLYHWDGLDCLPGQREAGESKQGRTTLLGEVPGPSSGKAEAISRLKSGPDHWDILVLYDGIEGGFPTVFRVHKPL